MNTTPSSTPIIFLRGLSARTRWVLSAGIADEHARDRERRLAEDMALDQGRCDFCDGRQSNDVPPLLADIPELLNAWGVGWDVEFVYGRNDGMNDQT